MDEFPPFPVGGFSFTYRGGPRDGIVEDSSDPPTGTVMSSHLNWAQANWIGTQGGTIGRHVTWTSQRESEDAIDEIMKGLGPKSKKGRSKSYWQQPSQVKLHFYRVVSREVLGDRVEVTFEYFDATKEDH